MKVLHMCHVPVPETEIQRYKARRGHPGRWALNHAIAQKQSGLDVEVVSLAHMAKQDFDCEIDGMTVHFLRTFHPWRDVTFYAIDQFRLAQFARRFRPDIIHAHGTEDAFALGAIRSGIPFCVTAQGLLTEIFRRMDTRPNLHERCIRRCEQYAWNRVKYGICKSRYVQEILQADYPHLDTTLIPNTYQANLDPGDAASKDGAARGHTLAFVGTMDRRKGVHLIADAMTIVNREFPDVTLHIAGNKTNADARSAYEAEQIQRLQETLGDRLVLHGHLAPVQLFSVLDECAALLAPSLEEMFGNQLIEALMRGAHGIVADGTAMAENVRHFGNGTIVPQQNPAALAEAICAVLRQPPVAAQQEAARQNIRDYMSPAAVAEKHRVLYERILMESRTGVR